MGGEGGVRGRKKEGEAKGKGKEGVEGEKKEGERGGEASGKE